jgi:hypothetical protein
MGLKGAVHGGVHGAWRDFGEWAHRVGYGVARARPHPIIAF